MKRRSLTDPARYAQQMLALLESWGIAREAVLRRAAVDPSRFDPRARGDERLTLEDADALFTAARELSGRGDIGFEFGLRLKPTSHGLLGFALIGCRDVDAMWRLLARQQYHLTEAFALHYERHAGGARAEFAPMIAMSAERLAFNLELLAVSIHVGLQMLLGDALPAFDIRLSMAAPAHAPRYRMLEPTRFAFDETAPPGVRIAMGGAMLALPLPMAAPGVVAGVEQHLANVAPRVEGQASWTELVTQILRHVEGAQVTRKSVAAQVGVSERTVERRLAAEGQRFGSLCDAVRFERARELLRDGEAGVAQIALRLGYSDAANFSRAFRRHAGMSPRQFQQAGAPAHAEAAP